MIPLFSIVSDFLAELKSPDELLPYWGIGGGGGTNVRLPDDPLVTDIIPKSIDILLKLTGTIAFITFIAAGIMLIIAHGNEELQTRAKNIFIFSIVGIIIILSAYAVIFGIATLSFE